MKAVQGISSDQVEALRAKYGENVLTPPQRKSVWRLYVEKYNDPIIKILLVAASISLALAFVNGEYMEVVGIFVAIFLATTIGFYFELDASRRFDELTALGEEQPVRVIRNGQVQLIARREVVVGDVVLLEVGDEVPADGTLFDANNLQIDESSLTGEPLTTKSTVALQHDAAYDANRALRSTMVMNGTGSMVVTAVGDATEIGKVARQATETTGVKTPLNMQLERLGTFISKIGMAVSVTAFVLFLGHDMLVNPVWHTDHYLKMAEIVLQYFMMAVALIVMAVPEGLPMAITLALALNMRRMLKSNNLVRKMHACETMGAVTVICTDKTGTLTQNKMQVSAMEYAETTAQDTCEAMLPLAIALNTTADLNGTTGIGNPTEASLLLWLLQQGTDYRTLRAEAVVADRLPFSTEKKYMLSVVQHHGSRYLLVKGAPEIVMQMCAVQSEHLKQVLHQYQQQAMRTLAVAMRPLDADEAVCLDNQPTDLQMLAVFGIADPLRAEVPQAVRHCHSAGIHIKIITGDTEATAIEIARRIGVIDGDERQAQGVAISGTEFAALSDAEALRIIPTLKLIYRARPTDKQRLVNLLQQQGEVVAVTGDGTNDAPALNHAHVGLSLGSGTSVAKNSSDITLIDDSFTSIVKAVMWGRSLYRNIQRFLYFQLVVNITALLLVIGGSVIGTEMPLTITQILWVNLIMDTFAAMALASLPPSREVLSEKPRSARQFIITRPMARSILTTGIFFFVVMFALLWYFERWAGVSTQELTIFFTLFVLLQWWNLWNVKTFGSQHGPFHHLAGNKGLLMVLVIILVGQWLIVTFGGSMFRTVPLPATTWLWMLAATSPVMWVGALIHYIQRKSRNSG